MTERHHFVPGLPPGSICACRHDFTGDLQARQGVGIGRQGIHAEPLQHIRSIDAGRMHPNEDLRLQWLGDWYGYLLQDLGRAGLSDSNGPHLFASEFLCHGQTTGTPNNVA
jgi:hypothetical protein